MPRSLEAVLLVVLLVAGFLAVRATGGTDGIGGGRGDRPPPSTPDGRAATEQLATLTVAPESGADSYERDEFGDGWEAVTGSGGCDVRDQVLADESRVPVVREEDGCTIVEGDWLSIYDNYSTPHPDELEIDHLVPLSEAWASGASAWGPERRVDFANDLERPDALVAVTAATNRSKSDRDPAEWMPSHDGAWCHYASAWVAQKAAWQLTVDEAEHEALTNILAGC